MNVLCIHPALAPYRLDFFNLLAERVDLDVAFVHKNVVNQKFDQAKLIAQAKFRYRYLSGFDIKGRNIRFGIGRLIRECKPDVVLTYEASPITMWHVHSDLPWTGRDLGLCADGDGNCHRPQVAPIPVDGLWTSARRLGASWHRGYIDSSLDHAVLLCDWRMGSVLPQGILRHGGHRCTADG